MESRFCRILVGMMYVIKWLFSIKDNSVWMICEDHFGKTSKSIFYHTCEIRYKCLPWLVIFYSCAVAVALFMDERKYQWHLFDRFKGISDICNVRLSSRLCQCLMTSVMSWIWRWRYLCLHAIQRVFILVLYYW